MKKRKYNLGGPVVPPRDTTRVQPVPTMSIPLPTVIHVENGSSHSKSKNRFREKSLGGQILQTGASFIPGVGQILSPIVGMVDQMLEQPKQDKSQPMQVNTNPFGKFAKGGILNDAFKQYQTGSHQSGNDLAVDSKGNPDPNAQDTVQNNENSYKVGNNQYVFSDVLTKDGMPFNKHAMKINKKYPDARMNLDQRNALDLEMKNLSKANDAARAKVESKQHRDGGPIVPESQNSMWQAQSLSPITVPTLPLPNQVSSDVADFKAMDNSPLEQGLDTTSFGTEITPGKNLSMTTPVPAVTTSAKTRSYSPNILDSKTANAIGLVSKGLALAGSINDALKPAEQEKLILPDYRKADQYMQSANIDYTQAKQDAQGVSNIGAQTNRSLSSNAASYQGREQARLAGLSDQLSRIAEAQNNANSQLNLTKGQIENSRAIDLANRKYTTSQNNQQNDAMGRYAGRILSSDLASIGGEFNKYAETQKIITNNKQLNEFQTNQQIQLLNSKYPNVKITPDIIEKLKSGATIDEILKVSI